MTIESLLDEIEDILEEGKSVPFTSNLLVNVEDIRRVIEDIRLNMPDELMQARKIASERKEILTAAQNSADEIIAAAHKRAKELVAEHEITKGAEISAADIMAQARTQAGEIVEGARRSGRTICAQARANMWKTLLRLPTKVLPIPSTKSAAHASPCGLLHSTKKSKTKFIASHRFSPRRIYMCTR